MFLATILSVLVFEHEFSRQCEPVLSVEPQKHPRTDRMNPRNLSELMDWGLLVDLMPEDLSTPESRKEYVMKYGAVRFGSLFSVLKGNGKSRVILNGIPGNEVLNPPPYFRFFSPGDIVTRLMALGKFTGFTLDIKSHFYRLPMHRRMGKYYAIAPGGKYKVFTQLPMGASWAPALGHTATLALVLYSMSKDEDALGVVVPREGVPAILDILDGEGQTVGHIFVCVDNIAVVCKDPRLTVAWKKRLARNAKALGVFPFKDEGRNDWDESEFRYIGVHYSNMRWKHDDSRIERWRKRYTDGIGRLVIPTAETLQSVVGVFVWDCRLRLKGMRHMREIFQIQTRALGDVMPNGQERSFLESMWDAFMLNEWQTIDPAEQWPPIQTGTGSVVLVTDASDDKWSWLMMRDGSVELGECGYVNPSGTFPETVHPTIYYRELYAVLLALRGLALRGVRGVQITLVGDSMAVIGSLRKRMGPPHAWWMLDEIEEILVENGYGFCAKYVESDGNVAHSATHNEKITAYRVGRSWEVATSSDYPPPKGGRGKRDRDGKLV